MGKDVEPSAELKAAMKACTENELCKKLMECKKKHKEAGGKGDGKGKGDHEEVCVEEMRACAADEKCSMLHEKLQAAMKKDSGYGGKGGDGKYDDKKGGYDGKDGDKKDDKKEGDGKKEGGYGDKKEGDGKKPPM